MAPIGIPLLGLALSSLRSATDGAWPLPPFATSTSASPLVASWTSSSAPHLVPNLLQLLTDLCASLPADADPADISSLIDPFCALALLEDTAQRDAAINALLPSLLSWSRPPHSSHFSASVWSTACRLADADADGLAASLGLLVRTESHLVTAAAVRDDRFAGMIERGLLHTDLAVRKRAIFLCERAVESLAAANALTGDTAPATWRLTSPADSASARAHYESFLLLFEVFDEASVHLIEPAFPQLPGLIYEMPTRWWVVLLRKLFRNENASISRYGMKAFFQLELGEHGSLTKVGMGLTKNRDIVIGAIW